MAKIPLMRSALLAPFAEILSDIGAPTSKILEKHRLPGSLEEDPRHYVPLIPALNFATEGQRSEGIQDIGHLAALRSSFVSLRQQLQAAVSGSPTLYGALKQFVKLAPLEDTIVRVWLERDADTLKVCSALLGTKGLPNLEHSQWFQNLMSLYVVRQYLGSEWEPATMAFQSHFAPSIETREYWSNSQIRTGQHVSWIDIPVSQLSRPSIAKNAPGDLTAKFGTVEDDFDVAGMIKLMLPAYLTSGVPTIAEVAEMAGTSVRSLQRRFAERGYSYSKLVDEARYEVAVDILRNSDAKIIEAAFASGYSDPAHLTRAFRRIAGVTPREFRRDWRTHGVQ